ncbi:BOLA class I histocompatibility antigen, alpha chain BL3-7 isoform X2 [Carassius gibelio]|uniref:BOLA class I histocompatibility antigen, alpha chain BL3-7 isoform X2 n=1 Tax=Carassius gibelio TaxID=101364 RepID=UPI002279E399|nr:BOLA class I histocompatibility antigen, alpha chain BL3-7 isoform X2 [Carassius gibelio]
MRHVVLLLLGAHLVSAGTHSLRYVYTTVSGIGDFPEYTSVGLVDDEQFDYFDSKIMKAVPKTEWMRQNVGADYWDKVTQIHIDTHQSFKTNIQEAKERFNHTSGVHTFQQMYGCDWDDQTGEIKGFRQFGYDGEDFLSLDLKEMRWISAVPQGFSTVQKLNNDRALLESDRNYFSTVCIEWLKKYLQYGKKTVSPQVSVLQRSSSSPVMCHATGFYPKEVTISWMKNDQEHHDDVDLGELLPNEDGTFQKTSELRVTPEEWKNNKFICVVHHKGETIRKILTETEIRTNPGAPDPFGVIFGVIAVILFAVFAVIGFLVYRKQNYSCPFNQSTVERTITTNTQTYTTSTGTTKTNISEQEKALIQKKPDDGDSSSSSLTGQ